MEQRITIEEKENPRANHTFFLPLLGRSGRGFAMLLFLIFLVSSCSIKKNTPTTRFYHAMTARFNTLYNGEVAYLEGEEAQMKSHQDDYNRLLPMYISTTSQQPELAKATTRRPSQSARKPSSCTA